MQIRPLPQKPPRPSRKPSYRSSKQSEDDSDRGTDKPISARRKKSRHKKDDKRGMKVSIKKVSNHTARSHFKILIKMLIDSFVATDDYGEMCEYSTSVHNPLQNKDQYQEGMENKASGRDIIYDA